MAVSEKRDRRGYQTPAALLRSKSYSVVIPVYNSQRMVGEVIKRVEAVFESDRLDYQIVAVNDGSTDQSWQVLSESAKQNPKIVAINLLKNYGQHAAVLCGLRHSKADYIITIDDDLQNPPEMIPRLIDRALEGYDFVCGRYYQKRHPFYRRVGSRLINLINERVFGKPQQFALTNFRLMDRQLVERICQYKTPFPYISGLAVSLAGSMANVDVEHSERLHGRSTYTLPKIMGLVATILFNYSSFPLRFVCTVGLVVSVLSFLLGLYLAGRSLFMSTAVHGWTSMVVLLSFYNGLLMLMVGMLGEYIIRVLGTSAEQSCYYVKESLNYE